MFILDRPKSDKPTYIFLKKQLSDGPFKQSLSVTILPAMWNKSAERAEVTGLDRGTIAENKSINALLSSLENFIKTRAQEARYGGAHLTCRELSEKVEELTGKRKPDKSEFFKQCRLIIADMESGKLTTPRTNKRYSEGTIKNYNQSLNSIEQYNTALSWRAIDMKFYREFIKWCNDKDWSMNYIAQHIKNLVRLMKIGKSKTYQYHNTIGFLDEDFRVIQEETDDIALKQQEMDAIYVEALPEPNYDIARDWFVIGAYLGLRVSDVKRLNKDINFTHDAMIIATEKTDKKVVVPINQHIRNIMKKWDGLPPKMHEAEINRHIKKVCERIKLFDVPFLYFLTKGGERKDFYFKKYEMVSCHTMRRFFITQLIRLRVADNIIMQLAGIKKHATLLRYKKISAEENAENMQGEAFFK
jgi:site-specific recombinase XerD